MAVSVPVRVVAPDFEKERWLKMCKCICTPQEKEAVKTRSVEEWVNILNRLRVAKTASHIECGAALANAGYKYVKNQTTWDAAKMRQDSPDCWSCMPESRSARLW